MGCACDVAPPTAQRSLCQPEHRQAGPGPTAGVGLRPAAWRLRVASAILVPASPAPPSPDWLSGPEPALHWSAGLPLRSGSAPSESGSRVAALADHCSSSVAQVELRGGLWAARPFLRAELWPPASPGFISTRTDSRSPNAGGHRFGESTKLGVLEPALNSGWTLH